MSLQNNKYHEVKHTYKMSPVTTLHLLCVFYTLLSQNWQQLVTLLFLLHPRYMVSLRPGSSVLMLHLNCHTVQQNFPQPALNVKDKLTGYWVQLDTGVVSTLISFTKVREETTQYSIVKREFLIGDSLQSNSKRIKHKSSYSHSRAIQVLQSLKYM